MHTSFFTTKKFRKAAENTMKKPGQLCKSNNNETKLKIVTALILAFGIFAQVLSEMMGYTPMLVEYLFSLLPTAATGFFVYYVVVKLRQSNKVGKAVLAVLLVVMFGWTMFVAPQLLEIQFDPLSQEDAYGNGWYIAWADVKEEVRYMLSKCHLFGHGDAYYQYSEDLAVPNVYNIDELSFEAREATMERDRAEIFRNFRFNATLPVLSYTYGFWVTILFAGLTITWCVAATVSFRKLNLWWEKVLYAVCGVVIAEQLVFPLLGGLGIVACLLPHPFAPEWRITVTSVTPQLGIMFAMLKSSKPKVAVKVDTYEGNVVAEHVNRGTTYESESETPGCGIKQGTAGGRETGKENAAGCAESEACCVEKGIGKPYS